MKFGDYISRKEYKDRYSAIRQENIALMIRNWELEAIALDAQFVLEENKITKYAELAEDIIDRVDDLRLGIKATDPDEDDE